MCGPAPGTFTSYASRPAPGSAQTQVFMQPDGSLPGPLRTGTYAKTLTFTLSTAAP